MEDSQPGDAVTWLSPMACRSRHVVHRVPVESRRRASVSRRACVSGRRARGPACLPIATSSTHDRKEADRWLRRIEYEHGAAIGDGDVAMSPIWLNVYSLQGMGSVPVFPFPETSPRNQPQKRRPFVRDYDPVLITRRWLRIPRPGRSGSRDSGGIALSLIAPTFTKLTAGRERIWRPGPGWPGVSESNPKPSSRGIITSARDGSERPRFTFA